MKLQSADRQVLTNSQNESAFTISSNAKMFEILSSLIYTYKAAAIVRELSFNAYDSHVEAGKVDEPFKVVLPNDVHPFLEIEDFGVGLDDEGVRTVYTSYGTSTKTDSNDVVGALGLGSKTPFAYTETFSITARKDGVERYYTAYIGQNGAPQINLLSERKTDACNGVKITVPIKTKDFNAFKAECSFILSFFKVRPAINDQTFSFDIPEEDLEDIYSGDICVKKIRSNSALYGDKQIFAVMGGVCYPVQFSDFSSDMPQYLIHYIKKYLLQDNSYYNSGANKLFLKFDIGELEVSASREGLSFDEGSTTVQTLIDRFTSEINKSFDDIKLEVEKYDNTLDRIKKTKELLKNNNDDSILSFFTDKSGKNTLKEYIYSLNTKKVKIFDPSILPWSKSRRFSVNRSYASGAFEHNNVPISYSDMTRIKKVFFITRKVEDHKVSGQVKHSKKICKEYFEKHRNYCTVIFLNGVVSDRRKQVYSKMFGELTEVEWCYLEDLIEQDKKERARLRKIEQEEAAKWAKENNLEPKEIIQSKLKPTEFEACISSFNYKLGGIDTSSSCRWDTSVPNEKLQRELNFWAERETSTSKPDLNIMMNGKQIKLDFEFVTGILAGLLHKTVNVFFVTEANRKKLTSTKYIHDISTSFEKILNKNNSRFFALFMMNEFNCSFVKNRHALKSNYKSPSFNNKFVHTAISKGCKCDNKVLKNTYERVVEFVNLGCYNYSSTELLIMSDAYNYDRNIRKIVPNVFNKYLNIFQKELKSYTVEISKRYPLLDRFRKYALDDEKELSKLENYMKMVDFYIENKVE